MKTHYSVGMALNGQAEKGTFCTCPKIQRHIPEDMIQF
jgi:hypothetical protein